MARLNKQSVIERIAEYDCIPNKKVAGDLVDDLLAFITGAVANGDDVSIAGFGKFERFERGNGDLVPKFRPYQSFKEVVAA